MPTAKELDVVVIGGGAGLTAAYHAERAGKSVAVLEERSDALGGTCVNRGCIPTKGLIQAAEVMKTVRDAERFGIHLDQSSVRVDFKAVLDAVRMRRADGASSVRDWVDEAFTPLYGRARFIGEKRLEMDDGTQVTGNKLFIVTGTRPAIPPVPGLDDVGYWTNETVLEQSEQPGSLIILGGGYIGCELAHFFATLGTQVTVVDHSECLLREDNDVRTLFTQELGKKVGLMLNTKATQAVRDDGGRPGLVMEQADGASRTLYADALLVATGRRPNTDRLDLHNTGVEVDENGWVRVDEHLQTTHPDIYAYGDVIGQGMFKHTSSYEGELAYRNAHGSREKVSYHANPHAVFSDPQIAAVGLTERACKERSLRYRAIRKDYADFAKGQIIGAPPGFAKLLVEEGTDRILGFHMVGPHAADLVHEVVVAMSNGDGTAGAIRRAIHIHPTLAELIRQVFDAALPNG